MATSSSSHELVRTTAIRQSECRMSSAAAITDLELGDDAASAVNSNSKAKQLSTDAASAVGPTDPRLESMLGKFRIRPGLDIFVVPNFLQDVLGHTTSPAELQVDLETNYPVRRAGDAIVPNTCQWVEGTNDALKYRGNELKRTKIWLQRGDPTVFGYAYYYYTGVQWEVVPAQTDWDTGCPEVAALVPGYGPSAEE